MGGFFRFIGGVLKFIVGLVAIAVAAGFVLDLMNKKQPTPSCAGNTCSAAAQPDDAAWAVANEIDDPLSEHKTLTARRTHESANGGEIQVRATCPNNQTIALRFDAFDKDGKGVSFDYSKDPQPQLLVAYRIDSSHRFLVADPLSTTGYVNVAEVNFSLDAPQPIDLDDPNGGASALGAVGAAGLYGVEQDQDIVAFLGARAVRIEIALEGDSKELIEIDPQDSSFQSFVSQCGIDFAALQQEQAKAIADQKAAEDAQRAKDEALQAEKAKNLAQGYSATLCQTEISVIPGSTWVGRVWDSTVNEFNVQQGDQVSIGSVQQDADGLDQQYNVFFAATLPNGIRSRVNANVSRDEFRRITCADSAG